MYICIYMRIGKKLGGSNFVWTSVDFMLTSLHTNLSQLGLTGPLNCFVRSLSISKSIHDRHWSYSKIYMLCCLKILCFVLVLLMTKIIDWFASPRQYSACKSASCSISWYDVLHIYLYSLYKYWILLQLWIFNSTCS